MSSDLKHDVLQALDSCNISKTLYYRLSKLLDESEEQNRFSRPMPWIGIYIALASLFCVLAMGADLLHGLRNRRLWFPCKYFTISAASLTVIAIAVKLPMDLNNPMRGYMDQVAKTGSISFMCIVMANSLPSLSTMDSNQLLTNMIAIGVLVITLVVNVCIQIKTGVVNFYSEVVAIIYLGMLLMLLIIYTCSSLAILKSKQILESKYQERHERALKEQQAQSLSVEKLKQLVRNYWIMAGTGSPQFMTACFATTSASGVICLVTTLLNILMGINTIRITHLNNFESDYKWSVPLIYIIQFIGILLGTIAPLFRCFASLNFKMSIKWMWNHIKVFKVESYWIQKLSNWKHNRIPFPFRSRKCKIIIENLKILILSICIGFQMTAVVACKMVTLMAIFFMICVWCCSHCWKRLKDMFDASGIVLGKESAQLEETRDLSQYVLQLQDDMEFSERTLKGILKSVNGMIRHAEKQQPNNLMKLLAKSRGFEGVGNYDSHHVPQLLSKEYHDCWSLPSVTLTTIAISLPNIQSNIVDSLLTSVSEGLAYVTLVEESLNAMNDHVRKAVKLLWLEVEVYNNWLGIKLQKPAPHQAKMVTQILQWFRDTAKKMIVDMESAEIETVCRSISANSMYRVTETILLSYDASTDQYSSQEQLFEQLSSMIADILAACLTNLPQVIAMKCHISAIEKREASVHTATQLLGETTQIINSLQDRELPSMNPDEMAFIEKWRAYLKNPFP